MDFRMLCVMGAAVTGVFGVAFVLAPGAMAAQYGLGNAHAGLLLTGRYFGTALLTFSATIWALRGLSQPDLQRGVSLGVAVVTALGIVVSLHGVMSGAMNAMGWTSVVIYGFFAFAWARLGLSGAGTTQRA